MIEFNYSSPENHVMTRVGISASLRTSLIELPREQWVHTPGFHAEPEFWLQIHRGLLQASAALPARCEALLNHPESDPPGEAFRGVIEFALQLVHHAHQHHHIEDSHFFPLFAHWFPESIHPLTMLDGDHQILSDVLADMENVARLMVEEHSDIPESVTSMQRLTEKMLASSTSLDTLFRRHISDEEDICIPIMLKMGE